jgi:pilus assembly protein Flp/PilA
MLKLAAFINTYFKKNDGATAIEYGLIAAGIALAIAAIVFTLGDQVQGAFQGVSDEISNNTGTP